MHSLGLQSVFWSVYSVHLFRRKKRIVKRPTTYDSLECPTVPPESTAHAAWRGGAWRKMMALFWCKFGIACVAVARAPGGRGRERVARVESPGRPGGAAWGHR